MRPTSDVCTLVMPNVDDTAPLWPVVDPDHDVQTYARRVLHDPAPITTPLLHRLLAGLRAL